MAGLSEEQWDAVSEFINTMRATTAEMNGEIKDLTKSVNRLQVEVAEINTSLFGVNKNNGLNSVIKANSTAIKELIDRPGKKFQTWVPIFFCILFGLATVGGWAYNWVKDVVKSSQPVSAPATPGPTP